jgi:hypothetical protein
LVPLSGGIEMTRGKAILDYLYGKKVVNVDVTELNVSLGEEEEVLESEKNVVILLGDMLSPVTPCPYLKG